MNKNHLLMVIAIFFLLLTIIVPSIIKVNKRHNDRLLLATTSKIKQKAEDCFYDKICKENKITLKELYENKYIEEMSNPLTKEYYNEESYVIIHDYETVEFIEIKNN